MRNPWLLVWLIVFLFPGCATSPQPDVDKPVTEEESAAVVAALQAAVPGNMIQLHLISGGTVSGGFMELAGGAVTLSHADDYVPERRTYELRYVKKVDVVVMRTETIED